MKRIFALVACLALAACATTLAVADTPDFARWKTGMQQRLIRDGLSAATVNNAMANVHLAPGVIKLDRRQPETHLTLTQYIERTVTPARVAKGRQNLARYQSALKAVEARYGVPPAIIMALWGKETDFGGYVGNSQTLSALATLAYEGRRRAYFEQEFVAAMRLLAKYNWPPQKLRGSWAGAIGQCQFMPSNYITHGVDGDHDGRVDLWNSMPDIFNSMGNLLSVKGWQRGMSWGQRVTPSRAVPPHLVGRDKQAHAKAFWQQQGVQFPDNTRIKSSQLLRLYQPDGPEAPAYVITSNFDVLMRWNQSGYFASAVGRLADKISHPE